MLAMMIAALALLWAGRTRSHWLVAGVLVSAGLF